MQNPLLAQEQTPLNQVVNTLKERISLSGYAQLGYTYDDAANPDNTFDIKRIIFMAHGKITKRWTCDFMYDFYNGGHVTRSVYRLSVSPGLTARIGEFKVPYTI
jgi:hypothetical protein